MPRAKTKSKNPTNSKSKVSKQEDGTAKNQFTAPVQVDEESIYGLIAWAIKNGQPREYIDLLLEEKRKERFEKSRIAFIDSKRSFLMQCPPILKNRKVPKGEGATTEYDYPELSNIIETIKQAETENGFVHEWKTHYEGAYIVVTCIVSHNGGHTEENYMKALPDSTGYKNSLQAESSAISYMRRITLMGVFGLSGKGDDNDARGPIESVKHPWGVPPRPTREQWEEAMFKVGDGILTVHDISAVYSLTPDQEKALNDISNGKIQ